VFESLGHSVSEIRDPLPNLGSVWSFLGSFQQHAVLEQLLPEHEHEFGYTFIKGVKDAANMTASQFGEMSRARMVLNQWCADQFAQFDLLVTPTTPYEAPPARGPFWAEIDGKLLPPFSVAAFTIPFNFSWHPASSVRAGLTQSGMPIGMQIVGPRHRDDLVLQASLAFEREKPWHPQWPTTWVPLPE
jgi:aspartyl-tRNA(Asn)/glutamyl-tRNA(Gln) amidotransferase subunit A